MLYYSMWSGQDFFDDYKYVIDGPHLIKNATDLSKKFILNYTEGDLVKKFEDIFLPRSNLTVYEIVNYIWIFRSLIRRTKITI